jgi:hypothetical protein
MAPRWPVVLVALVATGAATPAAAAEWGTLVPGHTTQTAVSARYGTPTRSENQKVDGYDTKQWIYEGAEAPVGMRRLTVEFGLLTASGYHPELLRSFRLEPKPAVFNRPTVINGWGSPTSVVREGEAEVFFYQEGLLVYFDKDGWNAKLMIVSPPQPPPASASPRR